VLVQAGIDILQRILAEEEAGKKIKITEEIQILRLYINELLSKIHERLKMSIHQYNENWQVYNLKIQREKKKETVAVV